jgi:hypothetical protein
MREISFISPDIWLSLKRYIIFGGTGRRGKLIRHCGL